MSTHPEFLTQDTSEQLPELQSLQNPEGDLYLRFFVESGQEFALPAVGIREVLSLGPEEITPVPNVSPLLMGILNLRGQVIWVTDIGQFLGDSHPISLDHSELAVIAIETQDVSIGLAVERVMGMDWLDTEQLTLPASAPDNMAAFLKGEWIMGGTSQPLRLLDPTAILRSARWAA
ncbi:MAG: chemotaxis protein CheW [Thermosynechococcaceae cyanobacterium]